jgi:hypothetical protein
VAVGFIQDFPGGGVDEYDAVVERMRLDGGLPEHALFHVAGNGPKGGLRVVDVWEDDDTFGAFAAQRIRPLAQELGLGQPHIHRFDVHNTRDQGGRRAAVGFFQVVQFSGLDEPGFDAMDAEILAEGVPAELLYHVNGPRDDGGWIVADGWTDRAARDAFLEARVFPVAARHPGVTAPRIEDLDVHATLEPGSERAAVGGAGGSGRRGG